MADIAKSGTPSLATIEPCLAHQVGSNLLTGEAIAAWDACYIKAADGKVWKSTGAAANAAAQVDGYAMEAADSGGAVTLYVNVEVRYGSGMTPGTKVFLSGATAGALADAASTGGTAPIGKVIDATRIRLWQSTY